MDIPVADWSNVKLKQDAYGQLLDAIADCNYPALYACLRKSKKRYLHAEAYRLCSVAIQSNCTVHAFEAILEKCIPELEEFVDYGVSHNYIIPGYEGSCGGLVQEAAELNRGHLLKYMLDHGCSPNSYSKYTCSALEAALYHGSIGCISVLEQREDVDFTITETLLRIWGSMGLNGERDICFRMIAGRLLGEGKGVFHREIPLLPGMTICHAAAYENWPLVCRMCGEQVRVTEQQGKDVIERYMFTNDQLDPMECGALLDALFFACPSLLRCEHPRYVLSICMLWGDDAAAEYLRPWAEAMPGRQVVLCACRLADPQYDIFACLEHWEERMGSRLRPVLRRDKLLPVRSMAQTSDEGIRMLLERCEVRGKPKAGQVSRLAIDVLQLASPGLLAELCQEKKLFAAENLDLLLQYCQENVHLKSAEKHNILLAYGKKDVNYEL